MSNQQESILLPEWVNIAQLAKKEQHLSGQVALKDLACLNDFSSKVTTHLQSQLSFSTCTESKYSFCIEGKIKIHPQVECHRSLHPMTIKMNIPFRWIFCIKERKVEELFLDDSIFPLEDDAKHLSNLWNLLAEEVILNLPIINYHNDDNCKKNMLYYGKTENTNRQFPFEDLSQLIKKK